jgi:hypothetical protein
MKILLALSLSIILIMATISTLSNVNAVAAQQCYSKYSTAGQEDSK